MKTIKEAAESAAANLLQNYIVLLDSPFSDTIAPHQELSELIARHFAYYEQLHDAAEAWKAEQIAVESTWDPWAVAKALGIGLGLYIRPNILPKIQQLQAELVDAKETIAGLRGLDIQNEHIIASLQLQVAAYRFAYIPDGHHKPHDCFATGPLTSNSIEDYVVCPGCRAEALYNTSLTALRGLLNTQPTKET